MSEGERISAWLALLMVVGIGSLLYLDLTKNERMAKEGYLPTKLTGDTATYWYKMPVKREILGM